MDPTCFSESIYNLIPSDLKEPPQPPRYTPVLTAEHRALTTNQTAVELASILQINYLDSHEAALKIHFNACRYISIFKTAVKNDMNKFKTSMKTMGPAKVEVPSPKHFLKKHSKDKPLPPKKKFAWNEPRKPGVPLRTDHPVMGIQSGKNFITTNAADAIMGVPKKPKPIYVDRRTGDKHVLETSGLVPKYIKKKDYGITPEYICKRNEDVKKAQEEYDNYIQENLKKAAMKRLSDEEREAVLQGLKKNWEEVHKEFQSLSVFIDSIPKKIRKQKLEEEMKQLEHDISVIEKHKIIYIANK